MRMRALALGALAVLAPSIVQAQGAPSLQAAYFFVAQPSQYIFNRAWLPKLFFLMVAGLNAIFFEKALGPKALTVGPGDDTPISFKIVGGVSLFAWVAVLYAGRILAFFGIAN